MVQLNESAFRSGARELSPFSLRPTVYRPSRPVSMHMESGNADPIDTPVAERDERNGGPRITPKPRTPGADR